MPRTSKMGCPYAAAATLSNPYMSSDYSHKIYIHKNTCQSCLFSHLFWTTTLYTEHYHDNQNIILIVYHPSDNQAFQVTIYSIHFHYIALLPFFSWKINCC